MTFLDENNAYLDCANDEINTTNANGKMISRILTSVSQNEIERTSERTKIGLAGAIKEGHIPGHTMKWMRLLKNFIKQTKRTTTHCSCPLISPLIISCKNKKDYYNILSPSYYLIFYLR